MNHRIGLQPFGLAIGACLIALGFFAPKEFWISWKPGLIFAVLYVIFLIAYNRKAIISKMTKKTKEKENK